MKKLILILIALIVGGVLILNFGVNVTTLAAGLPVTCYEQCEIDHDDCTYRCNGDDDCESGCDFNWFDCECQCDGYTGYDGYDCYY